MDSFRFHQTNKTDKPVYSFYGNMLLQSPCANNEIVVAMAHKSRPLSIYLPVLPQEPVALYQGQHHVYQGGFASSLQQGVLGVQGGVKPIKVGLSPPAITAITNPHRAKTIITVLLQDPYFEKGPCRVIDCFRGPLARPTFPHA